MRPVVIIETTSFIFVFSAPTGPPQNPSGMQVTTTLITLSWAPPEPIHVNGIIDHYVIKVLEVYTGRVFSLISEDESILLGPLHPYYIYTCQIAAYTVGLGPFGSPFSVQAGETRQYLIFQVLLLSDMFSYTYRTNFGTSKCNVCW